MGLFIIGCSNNQNNPPKELNNNPDQPKVLLTEISGRDTLTRLGYFYETGELKVTEEYINQVKRGYERYYYPNGILKYEIYYIGHKPWTAGVGHTSDGEKIDIGTLAYGTGSLKMYFDDGTPELSGFYKNNLLDSTWRFYYPDGKIQRITNWQEGFEHGESKAFYENGILAIEMISDMGQTISEKNYFPDGSKNKIFRYQEGLRHGECVEFYKGLDQIRQIREYKNGKLDGKIQSFYKTGELEWEGRMSLDKPIGEWKHYDKEGNVVETQASNFENLIDLKEEM